MQRRHLRAGAVERHRRSRHIGDGDIHRHRQLVGEAAATIDQHHELQQDRRADEGEVLRDGIAERAGDLFGVGRRLNDCFQSLHGIGDVGRDLAKHAGHLIVWPRVAGLAQADRHAGNQRLVGKLTFLLQVAPERAAADRHHHIVELGAARLCNRLGVGQRDGARGITALARDRRVERCLGRGKRRQLAGKVLQGAERLGCFTGFAEEGAGHRVHNFGCGLPKLDLLAHHVGHDVGDALHRIDGRRRDRCRGRGCRLGRCRCNVARRGADIVERLVDRHAGAAVDRGVMDLRIENALAVRQTRDDVELPERPAAIERIGVQPGDHFLELLFGARRGQGRFAQVIVEVELLLVDPTGMVEVVERRCEPF